MEAFYWFKMAWVYPIAYSVGLMPLLPQIVGSSCSGVPQSSWSGSFSFR
jgi:hypothetical protein